jgi:SAM-dependent methyltransferase
MNSPTLPTDEALQKKEFLAGEGDQWFARNRSALAAASSIRDDLVARIAGHLDREDKSRVLEIGCGQGNNLATLSKLRPIDGHGIEPSMEAVTAGKLQFAALALRTGTADDLPYADASFDVVWFGFCLYLVDRSLLMRAVAQADRVLRDGGLLVIVDFDPDAPSMRAYHHKPGLNSFKMDYARLFLANPAYSLVEKHATSHTTGRWEPDPQERVALSICRKHLGQAYRTL